ncbi:hypothetical protein GCM10010919_14220 [Alishewanella longhuensis]|uniref:Uncharacterized protein n=1 Tax=Alishewanella longhuensis TaxID=1091037 RepID=A0ABQ3L5F0_9ALTE|nr:hypothetical protein [Alishewanella longhuensis]GHG66494.1 hypothetical protein GCM10010919_14220 [Alishewanella longhuensis]
MDKNEAIKATKNGAIAATISGVITLAVVSLALYSNAEGDLAFWNDPLNFIDIALLFLCAFGLYRKSRTAAIVLLIYFIFAKIIIALSVGRMPGLIVSLVFLYYFAKAVQGTFVFHRLEKVENPDYKPSPSWYFFVGIPVGLISILAIGYSVLTMTGLVPSTEVLPGSRISAHQVQTLLEQDIIVEGEHIEYFYSAGLFSILDDGNLLTDRRVISYFKDENGQLEIYELLLSEIRSVELVQQGGYFSDSVYQINADEEDTWFQILLSAESGGDLKFVDALRKMLDKAQ